MGSQKSTATIFNLRSMHGRGARIEIRRMFKKKSGSVYRLFHAKASTEGGQNIAFGNVRADATQIFVGGNDARWLLVIHIDYDGGAGEAVDRKCVEPSHRGRWSGPIYMRARMQARLLILRHGLPSAGNPVSGVTSQVGLRTSSPGLELVTA